MLSDSLVLERIKAMRLRAKERDQRQKNVLSMRDNDYAAVKAGLLPDEFPEPLVANLIDTAAHDLAEVMAPLPAISCASSSQVTQSKKDFANKRALIANSYVQRSRLADQMYLGADRYSTFGYMTYIVEPDFDENVPVIRIDDALNSYFSCDYMGRIVQYVNICRVRCDELAIMFPDYADKFREYKRLHNDEMEIAEWRDKDGYRILATDLELQLHFVENSISRVPVRLVMRPNVKSKSDTKGQFDDVIWVQYARAMMAAYTLSAVDQAVNAPMVMPDDVQEMELGPGGTIQTKNPQGVGRVQLPVPPGLFPEQQSLAQEQRIGSRYPEGRSGSIDASIITGQGVQALMGTFDTQVQTFQRLNESALEDVISMCFEMDEALWPEFERSVRVRDAGSPVEIKYRPSKDIKSDYSVDVSYGAVAGLDPNRSLIFLLQAVSGGFMSRETGRKFLPVELDHVAETKRMDLEAIREAMLGSIAAMSQAIPQMAAGGADPRQIVSQLSEVIALREKGKTIDEAVREVFAPKETPQAEAAPASPLDALLGGGGGAPPGAPPGAPQIAGPTSPGQDLLMGLAGLTPSGSPNLQANVSTRAIAQ